MPFSIRAVIIFQGADYSMEVTLPQLRNLLYPMEWFFRFSILSFVVWLAQPLYPGNYLAYSVALYVLWFLILMMFVWQIVITVRFLCGYGEGKEQETVD